MVISAGLWEKWRQSGLQWAYTTFMDDKNFIFESKIKKETMELDEIKIIIGPYLLGIFFGILSLLKEFYNSWQIKKDDQNLMFKLSYKRSFGRNEFIQV